MKPKRVKINRLWHGYAPVRDYIVVDAMNKRRDLEIEWEGKIMTIRWQDLHKGIEGKEKFKSKHGTSPYRLIDFEWKEDKNKQQPLFS